MLKMITQISFWRTHALLIARFIMGGVFVMAAIMKFQDMEGTVMYITAVHFPYAVLLAWVAAFFELSLGLCIILGFWFREAALLLGVYALFLAFVFHGPKMWDGNPMEFGFFVDHFVMVAGLVFMIAHGSGNTWTLRDPRKD